MNSLYSFKYFHNAIIILIIINYILMNIFFHFQY